MPFSRNIQSGIDTLLKGSQHDADGNYLKARELYKIGLEYFENEIKSENLGEMSSKAVIEKTEVYKNRIKEIDEFLKSHPNFLRRKILTRQSKFELDFNYGDVPKYYIEQAIVQASRAIEADRKENYFLAIDCYKKAVELFIKAIKYEVEGELAKDALRMQCIYYLNKCDEMMALFKLSQ